MGRRGARNTIDWLATASLWRGRLTRNQGPRAVYSAQRDRASTASCCAGHVGGWMVANAVMFASDATGKSGSRVIARQSNAAPSDWGTTKMRYWATVARPAQRRG